MASSASSNTLVNRVSLRNLIDSARRLDELGVARVIANVADLVHKQQKGGLPLGTVTPESIIVLADGDVTLHLGEPQAAYTAPEKLRGEPGDRRSDVFALGAILWEALAHERLFDGEIEGEIKASVLEGEYRSASEANANVPAELDEICRKALARVPGERYPSAKVLAAELATVLDDAGYPDDNSAIAEHLQRKYVPPVPKAAPFISSRATPVPGAATQTIQGVSPRKEIDAAVELKRKKETLVGPTDTRRPAGAFAPLTPPPASADAPRAKSPSSQPLAAPPAKPPSKTPTLIGDNPLRAKAPSSQPLASAPAATDLATSASESPVSSLPSWATARSGGPSTPPETVPAAMAPATAAALAAVTDTEPSATLPGMPTILNTPPPVSEKSFAKTAILGSLSGADLALPPVDAPSASLATPAPLGKRTEVHGSHSLADRLAAIKQGSPPITGLPSVPPGADSSALTSTEPANITTAQTVPTPSLATYAAAEAKAASALDAVHTPPNPAPLVPQPPILPTDAKSVPPSNALQMAAAATGVAVPPPDSESVHPASAVSLPRPRTKSEGGGVVRAATEPGARDPVAGWGWGTGPHEVISHDDDDFYDTQKASKKRLVLAIGGAAAAVLLVVVAAFAFGGSKDENKADVAAKQTEVAPAVDWSQPTDPPPAPTPDPNAGAAVVADADAASAVDLAAGSAAPVDPNAGSAVDPEAGSAAAIPPTPPAPVDVAKPEPPKPEPPVEVAKPEPPKPEPPKKADPPKVVAKVDPPKKADPPKPVKKEPKKEVAKPNAKDPRTGNAASWDPLKPKKPPAPVDPYASETPKKSAADASLAYKTGIQQFARGDSNGALSTFKSSLASNPEFAPTWRGIGMVYEKLGKKSQAKTAFRRYLQLSPYAGDAGSIRERMERL